MYCPASPATLLSDAAPSTAVHSSCMTWDGGYRETNSTGGICDEGVKAWTQCCSPQSLTSKSIQKIR